METVMEYFKQVFLGNYGFEQQNENIKRIVQQFQHSKIQSNEHNQRLFNPRVIYYQSIPAASQSLIEEIRAVVFEKMSWSIEMWLHYKRFSSLLSCQVSDSQVGNEV